MGHVPEPVRENAIEIANALLEEGLERDKDTRIAIGTANKQAEQLLR